MLKKNKRRRISAAIMLAALRAHIPSLQATVNRKDVIVISASSPKEALLARLFSRLIVREAERLEVVTEEVEINDLSVVAELHYGADCALGCLARAFSHIGEVEAFRDITLLGRANTKRGVIIRGSQKAPTFWLEVIDHLHGYGRPRRMRFKVVQRKQSDGV
jgi:hypothetical protein